MKVPIFIKMLNLKSKKMYLDKILWFLAWPAMIIAAYYLSLWALKILDKQIKSDPLGEDTTP